MSWHVVSWVMESSPARGLDRTVLMVLADHAHKDGTGARASVALIAFEARCSRRSAQYALTSLEQGGCIRHIGWHSSGTKEWRVLMTEAAACHCPREALLRNPAKCACTARFPTRHAARGGASLAPPGEGAIHDAGGCNPAREGVQSSTADVSQVAPKPSLEPSGTIHEPPSRALALAREGGGEIASTSRVVIPKGTSARDVARLERTAARLGVQAIHEQTSPTRRTA